MTKKSRLALAVLIAVGFLLRVWRVGSYPPLLWDEASLGYNAFSILKTGKDEYGNFLPLIFKSFGDYKPGLYIYLVIPFIKLLGLTELAVRLPGVILGSLTPLVLFWFVKEVLKKEKLSFFSALALAFLPWHIHFSRGGWEANAMVFFLVLGSWLFVKNSSKLFIVHCSLFIFLLALWTYQGAKMMVPLILGGLVFFLWPVLKKQTKVITTLRLPIVMSCVMLLLMGVWFYQSFTGPARNRPKAMSLFSHQRPAEEIKSLLAEDNQFEKNFHFFVFHGEWLHYTRCFLTRYFNHFSPRFLAFEGDWASPRHSAPYFGMIGHLNFLLFLFGLGLFLREKRSRKENLFVYWLLIAPLPAALSRDIISGVRSLFMVIPLAFFIGYGLNWLLKKQNKFFFLGIVFFLILDLAYHQNLYFEHMVKRRPKDWLYGYKETIGLVKEKQDGFEKVVISDFYGQPYIYYLFYTQYSPEKYQRQANLNENQFGDVGKVEKIDNFLFRPISWETDIQKEDILMVASSEEVLRSSLIRGQEVYSQLVPLAEINKQPMFYTNEFKQE